MTTAEEGLSFYFFDIDDNLLFLPTTLYLWNAETRAELSVSSGDFARIQNELGRSGQWHAWAVREETFRDFRDQAGTPTGEQTFVKDLIAACAGTGPWKGPSWPLLVHAAEKQRPIAMVTARGHEPATIEAGLHVLVERKQLPAVPPILGIYTVANAGVRARLDAMDPAMTTPSIKKLAIKNAVDTALARYGAAPPHRFGMSDDDPNNVVLAISAMRDCKVMYPDKRFFVINSNHQEYVKLEIFPMGHPVTALSSGKRLLHDSESSALHVKPVAERPGTPISGGNVSVYITDIERAIAFYTDVVGLALRTRVGVEWAEIDAGEGLIIGLHIARPPDTSAAGVAGSINIELKVKEPLDVVVSRLTGRGVPFLGPILEYENVRIASFSDPDGNVVLLAQVLHS